MAADYSLYRLVEVHYIRREAIVLAESDGHAEELRFHADWKETYRDVTDAIEPV